MNPFIKKSTNFYFYTFIWLIVASIHITILSHVMDINLKYAILDGLVFNLIYFGFGLSYWYPSKFISFETYSGFRILLNHSVAAFVTSALWVLIGYFIITNIITEDRLYIEFLDSSLVWRFIIGVLFYAIIVSIIYVMIYYTNFKEKELKEAELNSLVKEAELKSLKYQINPHFIFNSLNSISSLTLSNPEKAREMTVKLSTFLRGTLSKNETQKTFLSEELKNVSLYLEIEKIRFEDNFEYISEIEEECTNVEVPNMLLQPVFENAIKHGVYESIEKVTIKLTCKREDGYLKLVIANNFDPESVSQKGEGIGLKNIKNRLKLFYNQTNLLTTEKAESTFRVTIFIPLKGEE